ncbi:MAG: isoleucine--tRNA ligase [Candidatus Kaelpia aquatica]|nr:isoleucine--tRNA ligase [Candidatus Kaelpia aquatica]
MKDYKETLNLPKTNFPMRGNLPQREPGFIEKWEKNNLYEKIKLKNKNNAPYILHDGPPYANGDIHLGHALNKTLKDVVLRFQSMTGHFVNLIPGWDCHGLPVEHQLIKNLGLKKSEIEPVKFRKKARDYALKYVEIQKKEFQRLGCMANWDTPYLTLNYDYEATILRSLADLVKQGYLYKDVKPVNWCIKCETALAEAEVEYEEHLSDSIYVKFMINSNSELAANLSLPSQSYFLIWTTTPWTLISNVAVALSNEEEYSFLKLKTEELLVVASKRLPFLKEKLALEVDFVIHTAKGRELEGLHLKHPFIERESKVVGADFVSMEDGTGCVHIAPGHGMEDYLLGREKGLDMIMPLNDKGIFEDVGEFSGQLVWDGNEKVREVLKNKNLLLKEEKIKHSYPHCWRCKSPIVFRATLQLFMSIDKSDLRSKLLKAADKVRWIPKIGLQRMRGMLQTRPDWCLSRQRYWGVAIPSLRCMNCKSSVLNQDFILNVADEVEENGADLWFQESYKRFLPRGFQCDHCGNNNVDLFEKENDIVDVWFESGISHQAVLKDKYNLSYPADLYLEGSDQHRGWFQSSLITGISIKEEPPYKTVLTHGFVVDGEGKKMSKSLGNVISPLKVIQRYGADVLRLWSISRDFTQDLRISEDIIKQSAESYRKIRNTFKFLLSNIYDYDPRKDKVSYSDLDLIDSWIYAESIVLNKEVESLYGNYEFNQVFKKIYLFMNERLSSIYLDILKDRMYTFNPQDQKRKSSQTVIYHLLSTLVRLIAPILPFTAEDIWENLEIKDEDDSRCDSVHLTSFKDMALNQESKEVLQDFNKLFILRDVVMKAIERKRELGEIGSSLETKVRLKILLDNSYDFLDNYKSILAMLFIVSEAELLKINKADCSAEDIDGFGKIDIVVEKSQGKKCMRCWNYTFDVGKDGKHRDVCLRCAKVLEKIS